MSVLLIISEAIYFKLDKMICSFNVLFTMRFLLKPAKRFGKHLPTDNAEYQIFQDQYILTKLSSEIYIYIYIYIQFVSAMGRRQYDCVTSTGCLWVGARGCLCNKKVGLCHMTFSYVSSDWNNKGKVTFKRLTPAGKEAKNKTL